MKGSGIMEGVAVAVALTDGSVTFAVILFEIVRVIDRGTEDRAKS